MSITTKVAVCTPLKINGLFTFLIKSALAKANKIRFNRKHLNESFEQLSPLKKRDIRETFNQDYSIFTHSIEVLQADFGMDKIRYSNAGESRTISFFYNCDSDQKEIFGPDSNSISLSMGDHSSSRIDLLWISYVLSPFGEVIYTPSDCSEVQYLIGSKQFYDEIVLDREYPLTDFIDPGISLLDLTAMEILSPFNFVQIIQSLEPYRLALNNKRGKYRSLLKTAGVEDNEDLDLILNIWSEGNTMSLDSLMEHLYQTYDCLDLLKLPDVDIINPVLQSDQETKRWTNKN